MREGLPRSNPKIKSSTRLVGHWPNAANIPL
nr:MAG TPA: hypothetical protein [Caudoviricetes sp.]